MFLKLKLITFLFPIIFSTSRESICQMGTAAQLFQRAPPARPHPDPARLPRLLPLLGVQAHPQDLRALPHVQPRHQSL